MAKRPPDEELEFAQFNAPWLNTPSPFNTLDDSWMKIIVFFVFHIPVQGVSARGTTLSAFRWGEKSKSDDFKLLKSRLMTYAGIGKKQFISVDKWEDMRSALSDNGLINFPQNLHDIRVTYRNDKGGVCDSLCNHIRNSFAHGRLAFYDIENDTYIAIEDIDSKHTVTARMILSKSVLLRWMEIIRLGPFISKEELDKKFGVI